MKNEGRDRDQNETQDQSEDTIQSGGCCPDHKAFRLANDLAIGVFHETVGRIAAGAVNVIYGRRTGLGPQRNQLWRQGGNGLGGRAERWDQFGHSLASGDFNGDGACDLAVGAFNEALGKAVNGAGAVAVIYGTSADGLSGAGSQSWHQSTPGIIGGPEPFDWFGFALGGR